MLLYVAVRMVVKSSLAFRRTEEVRLVVVFGEEAGLAVVYFAAADEVLCHTRWMSNAGNRFSCS